MMRSWCVSILVLALVAATARAQERVPAAYAPRGEMVDIGGRKLHLYCTGSRGPTVVIEPGSADLSFDWALVQGPASEFARVCSYDRAGYAWSDPGPTPRTYRQLALELHTALRRGHVPGPYVLVGHSYGGFLVRAFAKYYPREVVGMVLVEAVHENARIVIGDKAVRIREDAKGRPVPAPSLDAPVAAAPPLVYPPDDAPVPKLDPPYDRLPEDLQRLQMWAYSQKRLETAVRAEMDWSPEELARMWADPRERHYPLGRMPLVVITRRDGGYGDGANYTAKDLDEERLRQQDDLARLSHNSLHVVDANTGHNVMLEDPKTVVAAIREVVEAVRAHRRLPSELP
jgi:pimeloyl-ACP methyl ester carboxylesterase